MNIINLFGKSVEELKELSKEGIPNGMHNTRTSVFLKHMTLIGKSEYNGVGVGQTYAKNSLASLPEEIREKYELIAKVFCYFKIFNC